MRFLVILSLLAGSVHAEPTLEQMQSVVDAAHPPVARVDAAYESAMKLQVTGAMFMGAGIVHLAGSTIATGFAIDEADFERRCRTSDCGGWGLGITSASVTFALGAIFSIIGIPMYIEGSLRLHKMGVKARLEPGALRMTF